MFAIRFTPTSALHAIYAPHVIGAFAVRIVKPSLIVVGISIPGFGAKFAEVGSIVITADITKKFGNSGFPIAFTGGNQRELVVCHIVG